MQTGFQTSASNSGTSPPSAVRPGNSGWRWARRSCGTSRADTARGPAGRSDTRGWSIGSADNGKGATRCFGPDLSRVEMDAPQLRHFPRRYSQVTSGTLRYQGMEYWQCGQWEGGDTMLWPNGIR